MNENFFAAMAALFGVIAIAALLAACLRAMWLESRLFRPNVHAPSWGTWRRAVFIAKRRDPRRDGFFQEATIIFAVSGFVFLVAAVASVVTMKGGL